MYQFISYCFLSSDVHSRKRSVRLKQKHHMHLTLYSLRVFSIKFLLTVTLLNNNTTDIRIKEMIQRLLKKILVVKQTLPFSSTRNFKIIVQRICILKLRRKGSSITVTTSGHFPPNVKLVSLCTSIANVSGILLIILCRFRFKIDHLSNIQAIKVRGQRRWRKY